MTALGRIHFQVAELLHGNGTDVDVPNSWDVTLLRGACITDVLDVV